VHSTPKMAVRWCVFKSGDISCALNAEIAEADQYNHDLTTYYWVRDSSVRFSGLKILALVKPQMKIKTP